MTRLTARFWVDAYLTRLRLHDIPAFVVAHGDDTAGAVLVKLATLDGKARAFTRSFDLATGERVWTDLASGDEREVDAAISRQRGFDPDETLSADYLINEYDQKAVNKLLESLTPSTAITTLTHKPSEEDDDAKSKWETEEWFGTRYTSEKVDESRLARWQAAYDGKGTPPSSGAFTLPPPNPFLPTKFQLVNEGVVSDPTRTSRPQRNPS